MALGRPVVIEKPLTPVETFTPSTSPDQLVPLIKQPRAIAPLNFRDVVRITGVTRVQVDVNFLIPSGTIVIYGPDSGTLIIYGGPEGYGVVVNGSRVTASRHLPGTALGAYGVLMATLLPLSIIPYAIMIATESAKTPTQPPPPPPRTLEDTVKLLFKVSDPRDLLP